MEAFPLMASTAEQLPKASNDSPNDQDSLPQKRDLSEGALVDPSNTPQAESCPPENPFLFPGNDPFPSLDAYSDVLTGTCMLWPTRPTNPNIIHTVFSILLSPTIFEDLYGKALKSDLVGVIGLLNDAAQGWGTHQSTMLRVMLAQMIFHLAFWWKGIHLGTAAWNAAYLGFASASASLVLMIVLSSKLRDPLFYVGVWGFNEFAVFSFLLALPYWLGWVAIFSNAYLLWKVDPWIILDMILNALV